MKKVDIYVGVVGSGKSTYAKEQNADEVFSALKSPVFVNSNDNNINATIIFNDTKRKEKQLYDDKLETRLLNYVKEHDDYHVIYDATNLNRRKRRALYIKLKELNADVNTVVFLTPLFVLLERNKTYTDFYIKQQFKSLEIPFMNVDTDTVEVARTHYCNWFKPINFDKARRIDDIILRLRYSEMEDALDKVLHDEHYSKHHLERIDEHIELVAKESRVFFEGTDDYRAMLMSAWLHDLGKAESYEWITVGDEKTRRYINHENVSCQYALNYIYFQLPKEKYDTLGERVLKIVAYHMLMFNKDEMSAKTKQRLGITENVFADLIFFNQMDTNGTIKTDIELRGMRRRL